MYVWFFSRDVCSMTLAELRTRLSRLQWMQRMPPRSYPTRLHPLAPNRALLPPPSLLSPRPASSPRKIVCRKPSSCWPWYISYLPSNLMRLKLHSKNTLKDLKLLTVYSYSCQAQFHSKSNVAQLIQLTNATSNNDYL